MLILKRVSALLLIAYRVDLSGR